MRAFLPRIFARCAFVALITVVLGSFAPPAAQGQQVAPPEISYTRDVQPIFQQHCFGCHQGAKKLGAYRMTDFAGLMAGGETGQAAIVAGDPKASYLMDQITPVDGVAEMPKKAKPLSEVEIDRIRTWIAQGAKDDSPASSGPQYSSDNPPVYLRQPTITSIDASPISDLLAIAGFHEILLVDPQSESLSGRLIGLSERIESVRFSPDGTRLAAVGGTPGRRGELQIWNVENRQLEVSAFFTFDTLRGVSWSPDGQTVAFGATDNSVRAVDANSGQQTLFQGAHEDWVLGTAFTTAGDHVVSVARDMTCKLTETATERFIDNITSITPGALRGGLTSVVSLPGRDEILVGGADGVAKVYQVFRKSARKIGDDANLIRELPALEGRIFSVDVNLAGTRLAAVSTIDSHAEVRVWKSRDTLAISDEIAAILAKQSSERSEDEKKQLAEFVVPADPQLAALKLPESAAYACCFLRDDSVAVGGADGVVSIIGPDGQLVKQFAPAPVSDPQQTAQVATYDPHDWQRRLAEQLATQPQTDSLESSTEPLDPSRAIRIEVSPGDDVVLQSPFEYIQILVTAFLDDGSTVDVTRQVQIEPTVNLAVQPGGLVRPLAAGDAKLVVAFGAHSRTIPIEVRFGDPTESTSTAVNFVNDVNPVMSRLGCNQGTCHGAQKGKNGFKLSLRGYDPIYDVRALTDDLAARRVNLASPVDSLMLSKALGRVPHEGGSLIANGSPHHGIIQGWISQGAKLEAPDRRIERLEIQPENPVVQNIGDLQQVRVVAWYDDGTRRDVTREAFVESGNTEVATSSKVGLLTAVRRGEAALLARYEGKYAATTLTVMGRRDDFQWREVDSFGPIDQLVADKWQRMKIQPSDLCDDATFLRRVYLDLTGLPPTADEVRAFLDDSRSTAIKRDEVVDRLIGSPGFVAYWTNKWADLLQVNRKFLGAEGSEKFRQWIETAVAENRPYDQFVREILTSTGSNNEFPAASYYKILRTPEDTMENTTHLFLGIRFNCNKCHDHPFERWTQDQYYETAAFFAKTQLRPDPASGDRQIGGTAVEGAKPLYEEVFDAEQGTIAHPRNGEPVSPKFPFSCDFPNEGVETDRQRLANWMTSDDNPYFARSYVNRLWGYLLGVGLIEPIDDIRAGNPPTNPALLDYLTEQFIDSGFDARHVMRLICTSRTYQLSVATNQWNEDDRQNYSHAMPRRLPAEVLYDAIHFVTGSTSQIPGVAAGTRAASLPDAGVGTPDGFLANLGRPVRESACECERSSDLQLGPIMALVSGPTVGSAIADDKNDLSSLVNRIADDRDLVNELFMRILNRPASEAEIDAYLTTMGRIDQDHQALQQTLQQREAWWKENLPKLEAEQKDLIQQAEQELAALSESLRPQREQLEAEREARIAKAQAALDTANSQLDQKISAWEKDLATGTDWYPLRPTTLSATQGSVFQVLEDRSVRASGSMEKGVYEIGFTSSLGKITGFRLEALPVAELAGMGPGFPGNGNFVVTEVEVFAAPASDTAAAKPVKIASATASFTQSGFSIDQTFDGQLNDQQGWAVSPAGGTTHWAVFKLAEPLEFDAPVQLTVKLHQFHNAQDHRLARFRVSATAAVGDLPLGLPESFASALAIPEAQRDETTLRPLMDFLAKADPTVIQAQQDLAAARTPVPEDERVTAIKRTISELSKPIGVDAKLVSLRSDVEQSQMQMQNVRLTAAEDLTWALINSPAFLFNR
jgi:WD40 repeat protein